MKKKFVIILLPALLLFCNVFAQQINDPNAVKVDVKDFHGINVSNAFDVYLSQSNEEVVAVSASEEKFREKIKVEVKDGILHISYENGIHLHFGNNKVKLKAYISFKNIDRLNVSGACDVFVMEALRADKLDIHLSGASDLKGKLEITEGLTVNISGASDMKVSGKASRLTVDASGASDFKGYDFVSDYCDAKASGASGIQITVNKELSAHASGASDVKYKGDGLIRDIKTSGASNVSRTRS